MQYLLTSLNKTQERSTSIVDYIKMAFGINPRDIRYDELPSINKTIKTLSLEDRKILINEKIIGVLDSISLQMNTPIRLLSFEENKNSIEVSIQVNEENLKFRL